MYERTPILLGKSDFQVLTQYPLPDLETSHAHFLSSELLEAIVVEDEIVPENCIRLNSNIKVRELSTNKVYQFSIVIPENADIENGKISVLDPWGASFIGLSKCEEVERKIDGTTKYYQIIAVRHQLPDNLS